MDKVIRHTDNPAKAFLRRYRALLLRCDALSEAIAEARERATNITVKPDPNKVQSGGAYDRMAEDACRAADAETLLMDERKKVTDAISDILAAIEAVPDEWQKLILTLKYISGENWVQIQTKLPYQETQMYVQHGRALTKVNEWLKVRSKTK